MFFTYVEMFLVRDFSLPRLRRHNANGVQVNLVGNKKGVLLGGALLIYIYAREDDAARSLWVFPA